MADLANISVPVDTSGLERLDQVVKDVVVSTTRAGDAIEGMQADIVSSARAMSQFNRITLPTVGEVSRLGNSLNRSAGAFGLFGQATQQAGYQFGDFIVQVQSGTNAWVAAGQQATQLAGLLYLVNAQWAILAGTVASIAIPLATAFGAYLSRTNEATEATKSYAQSLQNVRDQIYDLENESASLRLGLNTSDEANLYREILGLRDQLNAKAEEYNRTTTLGGTQVRQMLMDEYQAMLQIYNQKVADLVAMRDRVKELDKEVKSQKLIDDIVKNQVAGMQGLGKALSSAQAQASTFVGVASNLADALARGAAAWGVILGGPITGGDGAVQRYLESGSADAAARNNAMTMGKGGGRLATGAGGVRNFSAGGGGGGGGGGGSNPIESELEALRSFLQSEAEVEIEEYQKRQDTLRAALEQRMLTIEEFNALEKELKIKHNEEMSQIDAYRYGNGLAVTTQWFSDMADAMQSGGEKMARVGRVFNAAVALQNSYVAFTEVLRDPAFIGRPLARFAAASAILAQGLGAVAAIRGGGSGGTGGSRGSVGRVASGSAPTPQTVYVSGLDPNALFTGEMISNLFENFYQENDNRGKVFVVAR